MKKFIGSIFISFLFFLVSCGSKVTEENLKDINGYWEIEQVKLPDGTEKDYSISTTIDHFEIDIEGKGFRQKVVPQMDGTYETNGVKETVVLKQEESIYWIEYKTEYASWKEQLLSIDKDHMIVKNANDIVYTYKRPIPFSKK